MSIQNMLTEAAVSAAKGTAKIVLNDLLKSAKGDNRGTIVPYRSEGNDNIICFVHGFCGDPGSTFNPIPDFIVKEQELDGWDVISIGYSTDYLPNIGKGIWSASPDLPKIAHYFQTNLDIIFQNYKRVAIIGHSMGGLVVQRALLDMADIHQISHVLFFGTPSAGLKKAWFLRWFKNQISDMDYKGAFIKTLREDWNKKFPSQYPFTFATVAGELDEFVPVVSSLDPFAEAYRSYTSGNHVTMVKPLSNIDTSFQIIKKALHDDKDFLLGFDGKALNNLVAAYHEDVNELGERLKELDNKGFRKYIFALEGTGKIDAAIQAIEESEVIKENTDFMGILGGRWKRKYLIDEKAAYLTNAINWYDKALTLSQAANNSSQIYYHAINLAFLYLMQDETNLVKTKQMAQLALDHCAKSLQGDYWEFATIAEANLYLNNFEACKTNYTKAVEVCNKDIRSTSSMMINAIYACNSLNKLDWKSELEKIFM